MVQTNQKQSESRMEKAGNELTICNTQVEDSCDFAPGVEIIGATIFGQRNGELIHHSDAVPPQMSYGMMLEIWNYFRTMQSVNTRMLLFHYTIRVRVRGVAAA